jgi:hypothetical protein
VTSRRLVLVATGLVITACTSTTHGTGPVTPSRTSRSALTSTGSVASSPPSESAAPTTLPPQYIRTRRVTAIGDPGTADLCAAIGLTPFSSLGFGTASYDAVQYPPGCSITLNEGDRPVLTVSIFAARHAPPEADGRKQRTASGLAVYSYPFNADTGGCERDVLADNVRLVADAITRGPDKPDDQVSCAATDAMADRAAAVAAQASVPRLRLAQPSVVDLNACAVVKDAGITGLGDFASAHLIRRGYAVNCELRTDAVFLFINAAIAATAPPVRGTPVSVGGHDFYEITSRPGFCSYASVQGTTGDGKNEEVTAAATASGSAKPPGQLCDQTAQALARYLTAGGLP